MSDAGAIFCRDERRMAAVRRHPTLNGIEAVESFADRTVVPPRFWLVVHFLKPPPDATFYGLVGHPERFAIEGGARIIGIRTLMVRPGADVNQLEADVSEEGDFSDYLLRIVVPDIQALERFILEHLTRIPGIKNIRSSFALKQVKYKTALPLDHAGSR